MNEQRKAQIFNRLSKPAFYIAILGAVKLMTDAFGIQLITDDQINAVANGLAALATVVGVAIGYE